MVSHLDDPYLLTIILPYLVYLWAFFCQTYPINRLQGPITATIIFRYIRRVLKVWLLAISCYLLICLIFALLSASAHSSRLSHALSGITECARRSNINRCNSFDYKCFMLQKECWALAKCVSHSKERTIFSEIVLEWIRQLLSSSYSFIALASLYILVTTRFSCGCECGGRHDDSGSPTTTAATQTTDPDGPPSSPVPGRAVPAPVTANDNPASSPNTATIAETLGPHLRGPIASNASPPGPVSLNLEHPGRQTRRTRATRYRRQDATLNDDENEYTPRPQDPAQVQVFLEEGLEAIPVVSVPNDPHPNPEGHLRGATSHPNEVLFEDEQARRFHVVRTSSSRDVTQRFLVELFPEAFEPGETPPPQEGAAPYSRARQITLLVESGHVITSVDPGTHFWDPIGLLLPDPTPEHPDAFVDRVGRRYHIEIGGTGVVLPMVEARDVLQIPDDYEQLEQDGESEESGSDQEDGEYETEDEAAVEDGNADEESVHASPPETQVSTADDPNFTEELADPAAPRQPVNPLPPITTELLQRYRLNLLPFYDGPAQPELNRPRGALRRPEAEAEPEEMNYWVDERLPEGARFRISQLRGDGSQHFLSHNELTEILKYPPPGAQDVGTPELELDPAIQYSLSVLAEAPEARANVLILHHWRPVPLIGDEVRLPVGDLRTREGGLLGVAEALRPFVMYDESGTDFFVVDETHYLIRPEDVERAQAAEVEKREQRERRRRDIEELPPTNNFLTANNLFSVAVADPPRRPNAVLQWPQGDLSLAEGNPSLLQDATGDMFIIFRFRGDDVDDAVRVSPDEALKLQAEFLQVYETLRQDADPENGEQDGGPETATSREYPASEPAN